MEQLPLRHYCRVTILTLPNAAIYKYHVVTEIPTCFIDQLSSKELENIFQYEELGKRTDGYSSAFFRMLDKTASLSYAKYLANMTWQQINSLDKFLLKLNNEDSRVYDLE